MRLPADLEEALEIQTGRVHPAVIATASAQISVAYRSGGHVFLSTEAECVAYALVRMPATYAAVSAVLSEVRARLGDVRMESMLDLGSGPGTAVRAAMEVFPEIQEFTGIEWNPKLRALAETLVPQRAVLWQPSDLRRATAFEPHDLVVASYSLGELGDAMIQALHGAWNSTAKALLVIEPGTPAGFSRIRLIREELIRLGAHLAAPCPHAGTCPMREDDWCHFSSRVERSSRHRAAKKGSIGYEDEKFSYVAVTRLPSEPAAARIIRHPQKKSGHVRLELCGPKGLERIVVTRTTQETYKRARNTRWGEPWDI